MSDVTNLIERMVDIEAKLGIRLSALSAFVDDDGDLKVTGEVNFSEPPSEDQSAEVHLLAYDTLGRVVGKEFEYVGSEGIPFDAFQATFYDLPASIGKIRVYVKKS